MLVRNLSNDVVLGWVALIFISLFSISTCTTAAERTTHINQNPTILIVSSQPSCAGTATYIHGAPQVTIYVTVDGDYTVTVTDNITTALPTILYTPPSFCSSTVVHSSAPISSSPTPTSLTFPPYANSTTSRSGTPPPPPPTHNPLPDAPSSVVSSSMGGDYWSLYSGASGPIFQMTTTVTVTKKTPVPVPSSTSFQPDAEFPGPRGTPGPPVSFPGSPTTEPDMTTTPKSMDPAPNGFNTNNPPPISSNNAGPPSSNDANNPTTSVNGFGPTSIAMSISLGDALPTVTLVDGVPVQVEPSSVYVAGSFVPIPMGPSNEYVTIAGQMFTIDPSEVIGPSTTLTIHRSKSIPYSAVVVATLPYSTITQDGITVTIEPTVAVVSSHTYTIGPGARSSVVTIGGHPIMFDTAGVILESTTYRPAMTTRPALVTTTIGQLVFTIGQSQVIVSGTMYGIGSSSGKATTVIQGTTVIFGPSGIVLPSTTIVPSEWTGMNGKDGSPSQTGGSNVTKVFQSSSPTGGVSVSNGGSTSLQHASANILNVLLAVLAVLAFSILPLSIFL